MSDRETLVLNERISVVFDVMGKSDALFVHDVKLLISIRSHPLQGISETDNRTKILRAGRGAICWVHMSLKFCFYCLSVTLTFERKQSLGEEESSQEKKEQSEKEWK